MQELLSGKLTNITQDFQARVRGLDYGEMNEIRKKIEKKEFNTEFALVFFVGKMVLVSFEYIDDNNQVKEYNQNQSDQEIYFSLFSNHFDIVKEAVRIGMTEMSSITEAEREFIHSHSAFSFYLSDKNEKIKELWQCDNCITKGLIYKRKCSKFDEETIEKIRKGYRPASVFGEDNYKKIEEEEKKINLEESEAEKFQKALEARKNKAKKALPASTLTAKRDVQSEAATALPLSPHYKWDKCPVGMGTFEMYIDLNVVALASSSKTYQLVDGGISKQPNKFIDWLSTYNNFQNEIQNTEHKISMDKHKTKQGGK